jgi:hypothetical protein
MKAKIDLLLNEQLETIEIPEADHIETICNFIKDKYLSACKVNEQNIRALIFVSITPRLRKRASNLKAQSDVLVAQTSATDSLVAQSHPAVTDPLHRKRTVRTDSRCGAGRLSGWRRKTMG